ncbi:MAG: DNA repair protein RecO [Armatimonadetes bacterium]|nr:DNA repair protein RecO [Armatimonadota bacterium]
MPLRVYTTGALVLRRINLSEYDKILTLFTEERGKLSAVAKGARKPVSRLAGATELFAHVRLQLAVGRSLDVVTQAETVDAFQLIRDDLGRIAYASVMAELLDRFTEERDPHPDLFRLTLGSLRALAHAAHPDLQTHWFTLRLLAGVGYRPHLEDCVVGREPVAGPGPVAFSPSHGGVVCGTHRRGSADAIPVHPDTLSLAGALMRLAPEHEAALALLAPHAPPARRRELDRLLTAHIQHRLERPIKSLDFLREVQAVYAATAPR